MKRIYYVTAFVLLLLVSFLGITYSFEYDGDNSISFEIIGPDPLYIDVNTDYAEYGIKIIDSGRDVSSEVKVDTSKVDFNKLGEYKVKYQYGNEYVYRDVIIIDKEKPVIELLGGEEVDILLGGKYEEAGYNVIDNYDKKLEEKVKINGSVNTNKEGEYILEYSVTDSSGNIGTAKRKVMVKKGVISAAHESGGRVSPSSYNVYLYSNTLIRNSFNDSGVNYEGYVKSYSDKYLIKLKKRNSKLEYSYNMNVSKNNFYNGNLDLTTVKDGVYDIYVVGKQEERLISKLDIYSRIVRAKVGNKLITFSYDNDYVVMTVEKFEYKYDFVIDPGHGGSDIGSSNGLTAEKDVNLMVSKYEKCRYESMGYSVYMIRYDDSLGEMLGNDNMDSLDRRGLTIGYYGAVSRIVYSNHHNGSLNKGEHGFEIIVQGALTKKELATEYNIYDKFKKYYGINDNKIRIYSKDYENDMILDKTNGQVYSNKNYYSILRNTYELFNVKTVIYEPIYMTNASDFNWYYASRNWIKVSEIKIKEYVNYIGGTYKSDNSKCL